MPNSVGTLVESKEHKLLVFLVVVESASARMSEISMASVIRQRGYIDQPGIPVEALLEMKDGHPDDDDISTSGSKSKVYVLDCSFYRGWLYDGDRRNCAVEAIY